MPKIKYQDAARGRLIKETITLRLPSRLVRTYRRTAAATGTYITALVREALEAYQSRLPLVRPRKRNKRCAERNI